MECITGKGEKEKGKGGELTGSLGDTFDDYSSNCKNIIAFDIFKNEIDVSSSVSFLEECGPFHFIIFSNISAHGDDEFYLVFYGS